MVTLESAKLMSPSSLRFSLLKFPYDAFDMCSYLPSMCEFAGKDSLLEETRAELGLTPPSFLGSSCINLGSFFSDHVKSVM